MYAQFFGTFLLSHNIITTEQLLTAMQKKASAQIKLGTIAIHKGYMSASDVDNILILQTHNDCRFGDLAVQEGFLTTEEVADLVETQCPDFLLLGQVLVQERILTNSRLEELINEYEAENDLSDLDYSDEKKEDIDHVIANFLPMTDRSLSDYEITYIRMLLNNLVRFIGEDFTPVSLAECAEYPADHCVSQEISGAVSLHTYIDMPEATCIAFASRYAREEFSEFDEYVQASLEDFLNLNNGLFNVNVSNSTGTELALLPPESRASDLLSLSGRTYLMPVIYPFGIINFLFGIHTKD